MLFSINALRNGQKDNNPINGFAGKNVLNIILQEYKLQYSLNLSLPNIVFSAMYLANMFAF